MNLVKRKEELNIENLLKYTDKLSIIEAFFNTKRLFGIFSSPLREDKNPSFSIIHNSSRYYDFATGESGDCFDLLQKYYNVTFYESLKIASNLVGLDSKFNISNKKIYTPHTIKKFKEYDHINNNNIQISVKNFNEKDLDYWESYGISHNTLKKCSVYSIDYYFLNKLPFKTHTYAYAYREVKDNKITYKIYQPFHKTKKFINNHNASVWDLYNILPKIGNEIIITSSRKDAMSIMENLGVPSIALQSETTIPKIKVLNDLLTRFNNVYILYDNDYTKNKNYGQINANKIIKLSDKRIKNLVINTKYKSKDFSDLVFNYNCEIARDIILKKMV